MSSEQINTVTVRRYSHHEEKLFACIYVNSINDIKNNVKFKDKN